MKQQRENNPTQRPYLTPSLKDTNGGSSSGVYRHTSSSMWVWNLLTLRDPTTNLLTWIPYSKPSIYKLRIVKFSLHTAASPWRRCVIAVTSSPWGIRAQTPSHEYLTPYLGHYTKLSLLELTNIEPSPWRKFVTLNQPPSLTLRALSSNKLTHTNTFLQA